VIILTAEGVTEFIRDQHRARIGHADQPTGQIDHGTVEVTVLHEHRPHGQRHPHVGKQFVPGIGLGQAEPDLRSIGGCLDHEHHLVADHLHHPSAQHHHGVMGQLLEARHHGRKFFVPQVLAQHGETDHVSEPHRHQRADPLTRPTGPDQHGPSRSCLKMASPYVFE
jgi:hypothetical protein